LTHNPAFAIFCWLRVDLDAISWQHRCILGEKKQRPITKFQTSVASGQQTASLIEKETAFSRKGAKAPRKARYIKQLSLRLCALARGKKL
jgi:hypothetical protein